MVLDKGEKYVLIENAGAKTIYNIAMERSPHPNPVRPLREPWRPTSCSVTAA